MDAYIKLPFQFDRQKLKQDLDRINTTDWIEHFVKQNYSGSWQAIGLRVQESSLNMHPVMSIYSNPTEGNWVDSPYLKQALYFQQVLSTFKCPLMSVRLMCLTAGSEIKQHTDHLMSYEDGYIRLHIPIQTSEQVIFFLEKQEITMQEGECWYLNFNKPHAVTNEGKVDRVHMVIDAKVNNWVTDVFMKKSNR